MLLRAVKRQMEMINNITLAEADPLEDLDVNELRKYSNETDWIDDGDRDGDAPSAVWHIIATLVLSAITITGTVICIIIIYILSRFKKLRNRINIYILNFVICYIGVYLSTTFFDLIVDLLLHSYTVNMACAIYELESSWLLLAFLFALAMVVDWIFVLYKLENFTEKCEQFQAYIVAAIYVMGLIEWVLQSSECFSQVNVIPNKVLQYFFAFVGISVIIVNVLTLTRTLDIHQMNSKYSLTIANFVVLGWLPLFIFVLVSHDIFGEIPEGVMMLIEICYYFIEYMIAGAPIFVFVCLVKASNKFVLAMRVHLKYCCCCCRTYDEDSLSNEKSDDGCDLVARI